MAVTASGIAGSTGTASVNKDSIFQAKFFDLSWTDGLTALAGGAQAGTALAYQANRFTTVASGNDSAQLPKAKAGRWRVVANAAAANALAVFPQSGEAINAIAADSAFSVAANKVAIFFCIIDGTWSSLLTA